MGFHHLVELVAIYLLCLPLAYRDRFKLDMPAQRAYLDFADQRPCFGIPNFRNVVSNLSFALASMAHMHERPLFAVFVLVLGIGSAVFHYHRSMSKLKYDRASLILAFGFLVDHVAGTTPGFIVFGWLTVAYWCYSEILWPYSAAEMTAMLFLALFGNNHLRVAVLLMFAAKKAEDNDLPIFHHTRRVLSGHSLKHLLLGLACYCVEY